jgi:hypothetical protein
LFWGIASRIQTWKPLVQESADGAAADWAVRGGGFRRKRRRGMARAYGRASVPSQRQPKAATPTQHPGGRGTVRGLLHQRFASRDSAKRLPKKLNPEHATRYLYATSPTHNPIGRGTVRGLLHQRFPRLDPRSDSPKQDLRRHHVTRRYLPARTTQAAAAPSADSLTNGSRAGTARSDYPKLNPEHAARRDGATDQTTVVGLPKREHNGQ